MYLKQLVKVKEITYKNVICFAIICGIITGIILDVELYKINAISFCFKSISSLLALKFLTTIYSHQYNYFIYLGKYYISRGNRL